MIVNTRAARSEDCGSDITKNFVSLSMRTDVRACWRSAVDTDIWRRSLSREDAGNADGQWWNRTCRVGCSRVIIRAKFTRSRRGFVIRSNYRKTYRKSTLWYIRTRLSTSTITTSFFATWQEWNPSFKYFRCHTSGNGWRVVGKIASCSNTRNC